MSLENQQGLGLGAKILRKWEGFKGKFAGDLDVSVLQRAVEIMQNGLGQAPGMVQIISQTRFGKDGKASHSILMFDTRIPESRENMKLLLERTTNAIARSGEQPHASTEMRRILNYYDGDSENKVEMVAFTEKPSESHDEIIVSTQEDTQ